MRSAYYGRQSERHRNFARRLRVNRLELHNIGSYLAELSPVERAEVKTGLVNSFFGQHQGSTRMIHQRAQLAQISCLNF